MAVLEQLLQYLVPQLHTQEAVAVPVEVVTRVVQVEQEAVVTGLLLVRELLVLPTLEAARGEELVLPVALMAALAS